MDPRKIFVLVLTLAAATIGGQEAAQWTILETRAGKEPKTILYQRTGAEAQVLICQKEKRTQTTSLDGSGSTLRWTKQNETGTLVDASRDGRGFVVRSPEGLTTFPGVDLPWVQDLNQLGPFVVGGSQEFRFVAFADFLDSRLKASDMTAFKASKVKKELQEWGSGSGPCWKVRVTFDDLRSAFWGADYWFRLSDGQLVRYEEVRGGPGTPVTVGVLASEHR